MSYWNNRIIETVSGLFEVREVYYNDDGTIFATTEEPCAVYGESLDDLKLGFEHIKMAMDKPVLKESEIVFVDCGIREDSDVQKE